MLVSRNIVLKYKGIVILHLTCLAERYWDCVTFIAVVHKIIHLSFFKIDLEATVVQLCNMT